MRYINSPLKVWLVGASALLTVTVVGVGTDIVVNPTHATFISAGDAYLARTAYERTAEVSRDAERAPLVPSAAEEAAQAAYEHRTDQIPSLMEPDINSPDYKARIKAALMSHSVAGLTEDEIWDTIALCETAGKWDFDSGAFSGGLGFANAAWAAFGNGGRASEHSRADQIAAAERLKASAHGSYGGWGCAVHQLNLH